MEKQIIVKETVDKKIVTKATIEAKNATAESGKTKSGVNFKKIMNTIILF